jgi:ElaB/YqjD/DUF883 family membrane-anchored ribosome-binding protein
MFRNAPYSRAIAADMAEMERRLRSLEKRLERTGGSVSAGASQAVDRASEVIVGAASALSDIAERFRGGARSVSGEAAKFGNEAMKFGNGAARFGNDALHRIADEVERRPLTAIAVVAGIGILLGLSGRRH